MEDLIKSSKQRFILATDIANDNLDVEVTDICDQLDTDIGSRDRQHKLSVVLPQTRSRSPVTVQEWVAALPDHAEEEDEKDESETENGGNDEYESEESEDEQETDTLILGAEGAIINSI